MRRRPVAVLREVRRGARPAGAALVSSLRPAVTHERRSMPGLPSGADHVSPRGVRIPGARQSLGPPIEVLRLARGGGGARRGAGGARPAAGRRRHVGAARVPAAGRARFRPGSRAREGARTRGRSPGGGPRPQDEGDRPAGTTDPRATTGGDEGCVRMHPTEAGAATPPAGGRRPHHRCHGLGLRRSPRARGSAGDPSAHRLPLVHRPIARAPRLAPTLSPCLYSVRAPVRVCGCPGINPGSRCQPRAKRPT